MSQQQMSINRKHDGFEREDLIALAEAADIMKSREEQIIQHVMRVFRP